MERCPCRRRCSKGVAAIRRSEPAPMLPPSAQDLSLATRQLPVGRTTRQAGRILPTTLHAAQSMRYSGRRKSVLYRPTRSSKSTLPSLVPVPFLSRLCLLPSECFLISFLRVEKSVESSFRCGIGDWSQDQRGSKTVVRR